MTFLEKTGCQAELFQRPTTTTCSAVWGRDLPLVTNWCLVALSQRASSDSDGDKEPCRSLKPLRWRLQTHVVRRVCFQLILWKRPHQNLIVFQAEGHTWKVKEDGKQEAVRSDELEFNHTCWLITWPRNTSSSRNTQIDTNLSLSLCTGSKLQALFVLSGRSVFRNHTIRPHVSYASSNPNLWSNKISPRSWKVPLKSLAISGCSRLGFV